MRLAFRARVCDEPQCTATPCVLVIGYSAPKHKKYATFACEQHRVSRLKRAFAVLGDGGAVVATHEVNVGEVFTEEGFDAILLPHVANAAVHAGFIAEIES